VGAFIINYDYPGFLALPTFCQMPAVTHDVRARVQRCKWW